MFSLKNSFDYKNKYNNKNNALPFTGEYELLDNYKFIYIYAFSEVNDTITLQYTNVKNDLSFEIEESFSILAYSEKDITLPKKLKYFRVKITTDTFDSNDKRIYNTYLLDSQYVKISGSGVSSSVNLVDENQNPIGITGDALNVNIKNTTIDVSGTFYQETQPVSIASNVGVNLNDSIGNSISSTNSALDVNIKNDSILVSGEVSISNPTYIDGTKNNLSLSTFGELRVTENSYNLHRDAFNRLRVSNPFTIFDSKNIDKKNNKFTDYPKNGSGISYDVNTSTVLLNCSVTNEIVIRESKNTFTYQPGKSLLILNTFVFGGITNNISNAIQRVGYFDDYNGIYLEANSNGIKMCKRTYINGSIDDTNKIDINNWNGDSNAKNLDFSKAHIFWIDIEWLGVGSVRTGFVLNGQFILAHTFNHANIQSDVYITSAQLPIRYEIRRVSTNVSLKQICSTVLSEGGYDGSSIVRHIGSNSNATLIDNSGNNTFVQDTNIIACAIRIQKNNGKLYNSIIIPSQLLIYLNNQQGNNTAKFPIVEYKLYLNPTIDNGGLTISSWTSYSTQYLDSVSTIEYALKSAISGTLTGGTIVQSGFLEGKSSINLSSTKDFNLQLGRIITGYSNDLLTYDSDVLVLVLKTLYVDTNNAPIINVAYNLGWYEL